MKNSFKFKKKFGQNFLRDINFIELLISSCKLEKNEKVLEIGPGDGAITQFLVNENIDLTCCEIDKDLYEKLKIQFKDFKNVKIINEDFLKFDLEKNGFKNNNFVAIGSLPFNISKKIIKKLLTEKIRPKKMAFIVQKEVAQKYTQRIPKATFLSNFAMLFSNVKMIQIIPKEAFFPKPKVDSAIIVFELKEAEDNAEKLSHFINQSFLNPRKKLLNNFKKYLDTNQLINLFNKYKIDINARAQNLSINDWKNLYKEIKK